MILSMSSFTILEEMTIYFREILVIHSLPLRLLIINFKIGHMMIFTKRSMKVKSPF